ncbi:MAG TPA: BatA domain-containing protein [Planctomycetota bacterium]|nr:BatA domain-containing protein [Planctomycetota bacterium]
MSFETPGALWALASLALLAIFSLWRQAAARTVVPSLLLWKKIPERNPPIKALRRPKWRLELLFQALAIASLVLALAGPFRQTLVPKARKIALVFDTSARMQAGGRIERMKEEARKLSQGPLAGDDLSFFAAVPAPQRLGSLSELRGIDAHVDLEPLVAAARQGAEQVIVFTDRPVAGAHSVLLGTAGGNAALTELTATEEEIFARLVAHGEPRKAVLRVEWGPHRIEETVSLEGKGTPRGWFHKGDFSGTEEIRLTLLGEDGFAMDNTARATRLGPAHVVASVEGEMPLLQRALGAVPGVVVRPGGGEARLSVGVDRPPRKAQLSVWLHSPEGRFLPKAWGPLTHPLTQGLRPVELGQGGVGELVAEFRQGEPLLVADGKVVGALGKGILHLSIDLAPSGWASTPSFPIFWKNVVDFASRGAGTLSVIRTGQPYDLPTGSADLVRSPAGAIYSLSSLGRFLAYTAGEYVFRTPDGERRVEADLLDERESDTAGISRPLDWNPEAPGERQFARRGLGGWAASLALVWLILAWALQRRTE